MQGRAGPGRGGGGAGGGRGGWEEGVVWGGWVRGNAGAGRWREMLAGPAPVLAPGAYDAFSARLVEEAGFEAVYMTGFGTAASSLGRPDVGLLTLGARGGTARRM